MDVPEFTLKEVHLVLERFRATCGQHSQITATVSPNRGVFNCSAARGKSNHIRLKQTNVLVQEANEGGSHDVPVFAAELHGRLYPVIHY